MQDFLLLLFSQLINWIGGNLVTSLLTGLVTGVTASIVVARLAKFEELRNEARRIVWGIDWIIENGSHKFKADSRISNLLYISSEILH